MKPRPASQRAMAAKPTQKQLRAAFASQAPIDIIVNPNPHDHIIGKIRTTSGSMPGLYERLGGVPKPKRRKIDGLDPLDGLGGTDGIQDRDDLA